jgi:hypothetical protein
MFLTASDSAFFVEGDAAFVFRIPKSSFVTLEPFLSLLGTFTSSLASGGNNAPLELELALEEVLELALEEALELEPEEALELEEALGVVELKLMRDLDVTLDEPGLELLEQALAGRSTAAL